MDYDTMPVTEAVSISYILLVSATLATITCADGKTVGGELLVTVEAESCCV